MLAVGGCELNQLAQLALEKKKEEAETSVSSFFLTTESLKPVYLIK
jgi:hypothetical protein